MFKFKILVLFTVITAIACNVIDISANEVEHAADRDLENAYKNSTDFLIKVIPNDLAQEHPIVMNIIKMFERSIDLKCKTKTLKTYKFDEKYVDYMKRLDQTTPASEIRELAFMDIITSYKCSNKLRLTDNFVFDLMMSFGHLYRAFKDEPELSLFVKFAVKCANNYVVNQKLWDLEKYPIDYELDELDSVECQGTKTFVEQLMGNDVEDENFTELKDLLSADCWKESRQYSFDLVLRTILLVQINLTAEQRQHESDKFFKLNMDKFDEQAICMHDILKKIDDDKLKSINKLFKDFGNFKPKLQ